MLARVLLVGWMLLAGTLHAAVPDGVLAGHVLRVIDGDTLDVRLASGRIRVRLHGIDAPERDQPGGAAAAEWLTARLHDREVELEPVSQDQYDRLVAIVLIGSIDVNRELVRAGHAWAYRLYLRREDRDLCTFEAEARAARTGLWAAAAPHAPWQHRATQGRGPFANFSTATAAQCWRQRGR